MANTASKQWAKRFGKQGKAFDAASTPEKTFEQQELEREELEEKHEGRRFSRIVTLITTITKAVVDVVPVLSAAEEKMATLWYGFAGPLAEKHPELAVKFLELEAAVTQSGMKLEEATLGQVMTLLGKLSDNGTAIATALIGKTDITALVLRRFDVVALRAETELMRAKTEFVLAEGKVNFDATLDDVAERLDTMLTGVEQAKRDSQAAKDKAEAALKKVNEFVEK